MAILPDAIRAIGQGLTEFPPLGARTHLDLAIAASGASPPDATFSFCVSIGVLLALVLYCWRDIGKLGIGLAHVVRGKPSPARRFLTLILVAVLPPLLAEIFGREIVAALGDMVAIAGWVGIATGITLFVADRLGLTLRRTEHMGSGESAAIGLVSVLALLPGAGRTLGAVTLARFLGYERFDAARFAILITIPAMMAICALSGIAWFEAGTVWPGIDAAAGGGLAFLATLISIALTMQWLDRASFAPFAAYQVIAGGVLLTLAYRLA